MNKSLVFFLIFILHLSLIAQKPKGRYFNQIEGTTWQFSKNSKVENISVLSNFGLRLLNGDKESDENKTLIWTFNNTLIIESFEPSTEKKTIILQCNYIHSPKERTLKLMIKNQEVKFNYVSISTGSYVEFSKIK
ncbi:MAG: hypothetical protein ACPGSD_09400 [Flavobacteriales bacterium]